MNVGIIGLGLMGGSIAQALQQRHHIVAYDINEDALQYAMDHKIIHEMSRNLTDFAQKVQVVFLCLYPNDIITFIKDHQLAFSSNTVLIEIAGIKTKFVKDLLPFLRQDLDLVMTHPIAGREKIGVRHANPSIFNKQNFVIVPTDRNTPEHLELVREFAREMGFGTITDLSPEAHDEIIAYTSQLTHVLSLALVDADDFHFQTARFIGDSYRDLTRIAMINEKLWSDLLIANHAHLIPRIDQFIDSLSRYKDAIQNNDVQTLVSLMELAKERRFSIEKDVKE
jgi:prephenate dehydrogenase